MKAKSDDRRLCAEAYLDYVRSLQLRIRFLHDDIEAKRSLVEVAGAQVREHVTGGRYVNRLEDGVMELQELISQYCTELVEYVEAQKQAHELLDLLPRHEWTLALNRYYLQGKEWKDVCKEMNYTHDGIMKLRRKAIDALYDYLPLEWRLRPQVA